MLSDVEVESLVVSDVVLGISVVESAVVLVVLESAVVLEVLDALDELWLVVVVAVVEDTVSTMIVARSTACVFGSALAFPTHML